MSRSSSRCRTVARQALLVGAALLLCVSLAPQTLLAQGNFDSVEIKTQKITDTVSMLIGAGGNIGVSVGDSGILVVDDQFEPLVPKIKAAIAELKAGDIDYVINTHWHFDHTGGNAKLGLEAAILAHENVRVRMAKGQETPRPTPPAPEVALPVLTFKESTTIHWNGEAVDVIYLPNGHTDGDSVVFFRGSNVVHMGDHFFNGGTFPFVDLNSGGNAIGLRDNIKKVLSMVDDNTQIIPGHGPLGTKKDLARYHQMLDETIAHIKKSKDAGKSLDEAKAAGIPAAWQSLGEGGFIKTDQWIEFVYSSL